MSSKNESSKVRYANKTYTKIVDYDTPSNNSEGTVNTSVLFTNLESNAGEDRPNWRALVAAHSSAGNPVHANKTTFELEPFSCTLLIQRKRLNGSPPGRIVYRTELTKYQPKYYTSITAPSVGVHLSWVKTLATQKFVEKAQSRITPTQLGIVFGELNETIRMIRRPASGIRKGISRYLTKVNKNLRRNKRLPVPKRNSIVADTWLEFAFGWAPLIGDCEDAAEAAAKVAAGVQLHVVKTEQGAESVTEAGGSLAYPGAGAHDFDMTKTTTTKCSLYGMMRPEYGPKVPFPDAFGLRPHDILPTIWELVPWSFAIDYFTGIGDYISSMCFPVTSMQWYCRSTHTIVERATSNYRVTGNMAQESTNLSIKTEFTTGKSSCKVETFDRETASMIDLVSPVRFSLPAGKKPYWNLAALARARTIK